MSAFRIDMKKYFISIYYTIDQRERKRERERERERETKREREK